MTPTLTIMPQHPDSFMQLDSQVVSSQIRQVEQQEKTMCNGQGNAMTRD